MWCESCEWIGVTASESKDTGIHTANDHFPCQFCVKSLREPNINELLQVPAPPKFSYYEIMLLKHKTLGKQYYIQERNMRIITECRWERTFAGCGAAVVLQVWAVLALVVLRTFTDVVGCNVETLATILTGVVQAVIDIQLSTESKRREQFSFKREKWYSLFCSFNKPRTMITANRLPTDHWQSLELDSTYTKF